MNATMTDCPCAACMTTRGYGYPILCCPNGFVHGSCCTHGSRYVSAPLTAAPGASEPSVASMRGILAGFTRVGPESDAERMDWLEAQGVVSIYLNDGRQINAASMSLRAAIDAAQSDPMRRAPTQEDERMSETTTEAGRALDALIAERVMGLPVVGKACCVYVEGESSVHVDSSPDGWMCAAELGPVYADHYGHECTCATDVPRQRDPKDYPYEKYGVGRSRKRDEVEWYAYLEEQNAKARADHASDLATFGHSRDVLHPVPFYSTDIATAWLVVEKMARDGFTFDVEWKGADREYAFTAEASFRAGFITSGHAVADTAPLAICRAALAASPAGATP